MALEKLEAMRRKTVLEGTSDRARLHSSEPLGKIWTGPVHFRVT